MNRCQRSSTPFCLLFAVVVSVFAPQAAAQADEQTLVEDEVVSEATLGGRNFPAGALRGSLVVIDAPVIRLDGRQDRLSPGARIRDARNQSVVPAAVIGLNLLVNYTRDASGLVREVWVLTPEEAAARRASAERPFLGGLWPFTVSNQPRDDGLTPFADLPFYGQ